MAETAPPQGDIEEIPPSHSATPLEIDDGGDEGENQHSLPNVEELKVNNSSAGSGGSNLFLWYLIMIMLLSAAVVGLSVGLTADNRAEKKADNQSVGSAISSKDRLLGYEKYLIKHLVSTEADFDNLSSPQSRALNFLANDDKKALAIPTGDLTSKEGYAFITRYIMALFYYATSGARWNYDLLFMSDHDTCDWYEVFKPPVGQVGVLCNENTKEIVGLSFISNGLDGTFPQELGQLTTMTYLESIGNNMRGKLPVEFSRLTSLRTMVMAFNQLTGTMPNWITKIDKLEFFYLSNNLFSGSIPAEFGNLKELAVLALDDNQFTGTADFLWDLPKLEYVYMEDNEFTGQLPGSLLETNDLLINLDVSNNLMNGRLPNDIFRLSKLEIIDLHDNGFTGAIPSDINANDRLQYLALHGNKLNSAIPPTLGNLVKLKHLDLSKNELTGTIPQEFEEFNDMTYLFLADNPLTAGSIPTFLYTLRSLKELSLKSTNRQGEIEPLIAFWDKLILLDLDQNDLSGNIPTEIGELTNMQFLLLNRNNFTGNVPFQLSNMKELRFILLDQNSLGGDLNAVCDNEPSIIGADCQELSCDCCDPCCVDTDPTGCHDFNLVANSDPVWESKYERQFFDFSAGDSTAYAPLDDDEFGETR